MKKNFDKFYTKREIAKQCVEFLSKYETLEGSILEPSAGSGNFLVNLPNNTIGLDILPENDNIIKMNFFDFFPMEKDFITIGNPPFGSRCKLAIDFFNHAAEFSKTIAFIIPVTFMKYSVQKQLNKDFKLVDYFYLPENSFTDNGKEFSVRCVFQVWKKDSDIDLRLKKSPPIKHSDFDCWQYNATPEAFSCIDKDWDIAFYRQGYKDYTRRFDKTEKEIVREQMKNNIQFFFVKYKAERSKDIISKIDLESLADRNLSVRGYGKADFVSAYTELLEKEKE